MHTADTGNVTPVSHTPGSENGKIKPEIPRTNTSKKDSEGINPPSPETPTMD